jgi:uncharacterized protein
MSYRTSVRGLFDALASSRTVTGEIEAADAEMGGQVFHFEGPISFEVTLTNAGTGIVAQGSATATVVTPCSRCLCDAHLTVEADIDGFYVLPGHDADFPEEQEAELIAEDLTIDLEPAVVADVVVELPFAPLHAESCKGICPVCGADLNLESCGCARPVAASPFAALKDLDLEDDAEA